MEGYIKLWRKIQENPLWQEERFTKAQAWIDLLLKTNHKDGIAELGQGNTIVKTPVKKGSLITSQRKLASRWQWGQASVGRFLKELEGQKMISVRVVRGLVRGAVHGFSYISILNWAVYQENLVRGFNEKLVTNKNDINKKNIGFAKSKPSIPSKRKELPRKKQSFPEAWYKDVLSAYCSLKEIEIHGPEILPLRQEIKTMFLSERKPGEIITCMKWFASSEEEWVENWTLKTVRMKLPEFLGGKFNKNNPDLYD